MSEFSLEIYTQDRRVLSEQVRSMIVPAMDGYLGVLAHHAPLVTLLGEGTLTLKGGDVGERVYPVAGGFLEVAHNHATLLVDRIELPEEQG